MILNERTYAMIELLEAIDLFHAVGASTQNDMMRVKTWKKAVETRRTLRSGRWEAQTHNELYRPAHMLDMPLQTIIEEVESLTRPIVVAKVNPFIEHDVALYPIAGAVSWDFLHIAIASELADISPLDAFVQVLAWYICGHFPCGWQGRYPKGKLIIY